MSRTFQIEGKGFFSMRTDQGREITDLCFCNSGFRTGYTRPTSTIHIHSSDVTVAIHCADHQAQRAVSPLGEIVESNAQVNVFCGKAKEQRREEGIEITSLSPQVYSTYSQMKIHLGTR